MKKVTAVLPARNCRQQLHRCLSGLSAGKYTPEIIVVDDGSDDGTQQMIRRHWPSVTYLRVAAHTGYAHAANAGLRIVRTEYAFLIRPDLQPGRLCIDRLLEAMDEDVFCAVPEFRTASESKSSRNTRGGIHGFLHEKSRREFHGESREEIRRKCPAGHRAAARVIAVPDGCALYRMRALEEIGWLDERHYDGLEAFDLSLRALAAGWRSVKVTGAAVRTAAGRSDTFHRQLAAGNGIYVFYKHIPGAMRIPGLPLFAAAGAAQIASFVRRGESGAYRMAKERGRALCGLEKNRRAALDGCVSVWPENLPDASYLGMDEEAGKIYPLFLAEKEPASIKHIPRYLYIQGRMAAELPQIIRMLL